MPGLTDRSQQPQPQQDTDNATAESQYGYVVQAQKGWYAKQNRRYLTTKDLGGIDGHSALESAVKRIEGVTRIYGRRFRAGYGDAVAAGGKRYAQILLDAGKILVEFAEQQGKQAVVPELNDNGLRRCVRPTGCDLGFQALAVYCRRWAAGRVAAGGTARPESELAWAAVIWTSTMVP